MVAFFAQPSEPLWLRHRGPGNFNSSLIVRLAVQTAPSWLVSRVCLGGGSGQHGSFLDMEKTGCEDIKGNVDWKSSLAPSLEEWNLSKASFAQHWLKSDKTLHQIILESTKCDRVLRPRTGDARRLLPSLSLLLLSKLTRFCADCWLNNLGRIEIFTPQVIFDAGFMLI